MSDLPTQDASTGGTLNRRYAPATHRVTSRLLEGETMLVDLKSDVYYYLNPVGTVAWENLDGTKTGHDLVALLFSQFDAPEEVIRQDVEQLLTDLLAMGLVEEKKT